MFGVRTLPPDFPSARKCNCMALCFLFPRTDTWTVVYFPTEMAQSDFSSSCIQNVVVVSLDDAFLSQKKEKEIIN